MNTEYLPSFIKDLKALKSSASYGAIERIAFEEIPGFTDSSEIRNLKKLKASDCAYRIRVGEYRIGVFLRSDTVVFSRVLHRSKIYKAFP